MTSRWRGKGRTSAVYQQQQQRVIELEILLTQKDETIADLEKRMTEQVQAVKKLRRDREELRYKNAALVGKLAEVSRKNSVAIFSTGNTPPTQPRIFHRTSTCRLPDLPESPNHYNGTPPSDRTPDTPAKSRQPPTQISTEDSDTDYSDIEDEGKNREDSKSALKKKMDQGDATQAEIDNELAAVLSTARNSELNQTRDKPVPASSANRWRRSSSPPLYPRKRQGSSESSASSSASYSSGGSREGGYQVSGRSQSDVAKNPLKMHKIQSSERLASTIRQMIPKRTSEHSLDVGDPPRRSSQQSLDGGDMGGPLRETSQHSQKNGDVISSAAPKGGNSLLSGWLVVQSSNTSSVLLSNGVPNGSSSKTLDAEEIESHVQTERNGEGGTKGKKKTTFSASSNIIPVLENSPLTRTCTESTSSDCPSSEAFPTDMESSMEVFSPTISPLDANVENDVFLRTVHKSLPDLAKGGVLRPIATARLEAIYEKRKSAVMDDTNLEEEDTLDELASFKTDVRARTHTLSALTGGKRRMELGRKKLKEHRLEMKRFSSVSTSTGLSQGVEPSPRERADTKHELELLSPILQAKIRNMTLKRIFTKYGGKDVVTRAVEVITSAYQTYRLKRRFLERQKEKRENRTLQRKRALSLRQPNRRPSIMYKNRDRYKTEKDPILKSKETAVRLAKERVPHAHSGARQELVERRRSETSLKGEPLIEGEEEEEKKTKGVMEKKKLISSLSISQIEVGLEISEEEGSSQEMQAQDIVVTLTIEQAEEQSVDSNMKGVPSQDERDGIVGSESAQSLSLDPRPLSIFSTSSMESCVADYSSLSVESGLLHVRTLPHTSPINRKEPKKEVDMKLVTGIYYFNKKPVKGIQYLIRNSLLEDDPKGVADFFIHQSGLSKEKIGEFLGEINSEFNMAVLESIVERSNMGDKPIDEALREFQQMFRMPGEAQKIDKIMEVFALEYHLHNKSLGVFKSEDSAYILSFAIMMLHTSLHNPSVKSRTSRKQWLSMNRGNNDGENFPHNFLLEIFDRIQATEFATGKDHTHRVADIEKQISGLPIQKLSVPHRYLVLKMSTSEIQELGVRPGFRSRHRRTLFFFNDIAVICKRKHNDFVFKDTFSLLNVLPVKFESHHYKYGVQLHAVDKDVPYQFNCNSSSNREQLLCSLETITQHMKLLETERITALGTSFATNRIQDSTTDGAALVRNVGDLMSSLATPSPSSPPSKHRADFVSGVGDLLVTTSLPVNFIQIQTENRISRDSSFSSQQLTPTPPPSPSINKLNPAFATPTISPTGSFNTLAPAMPPIKTSKSAEFDGQKLLSSSPNQSPSTDLFRRRKSTPAASINGASPLLDEEGTTKKKERGTSDKSHRKGIFSAFNKSKVKDCSDGGKSKVKNLSGKEHSASPQAHRKLVQKNNNKSLDDSSLESAPLIPS